MPDLLFEIGIEDMPALEAPCLAAQLSKGANQAFAQQNLNYARIEVFYTPRRLALLVHDLDKGPGTTTVALLAEILPVLLTGLRPIRSMRWDSSGLTFVRPIRWLVCLYGDEVVPLTMGELRADRVTCGSRLSGSKEWVVLRDASDYKATLEEVSIIVDANERRKRVDLALTTAVTGSATGTATGTATDGMSTDPGGECWVSEEMLVRVVNSVEYPTPIVVRIPPLVNGAPACLDLPVEVLQAALSTGRIFIPIVLPDRRILAFIGFCDRPSGECPSGDTGFIHAGFERAILARLRDARFFFDQDRQRPFAEYVRKLRNIDDEIHPGGCRFGSLWEKTERIRALAAEIATAVGETPRELVDRAAFLCKADLATELVRAFPELRGVAGGIYAELDKEPIEVALAIRRHYFADTAFADTAFADKAVAKDRLPSSNIAVVIGLADMLDTIVCAVLAGLQPNGLQSNDLQPNGLPDLIDLAVQQEIDLDFIALAEQSIDIYAPLKKKTGPEGVGRFLTEYVRRALKERYQIPAAVTAALSATKMGNFYRVLKRAHALVEWQNQPKFQALATSFAKVRKIIAGAVDTAQYEPGRFVEEAEQGLWREYLKADGRLRRPLEEGDYKGAIEHLIPLQGALDRYLGEVVVTAAAADLKRNRLGFLRALADLFLTVGDLGAIVEISSSRPPAHDNLQGAE